MGLRLEVVEARDRVLHREDEPGRGRETSARRRHGRVSVEISDE
jgi:hypothetical protein